MKSLYASGLAMLISVTIVGMVAINIQQVYARNGCDTTWCFKFKILTDELEKSVLEAAVNNPTAIPGLLEKYNQDALELLSPSTSIAPSK